MRSVAETTRRYFAVLYRRELHRLTARLAELNAELLGVLQRRFQAGQATAGDVALGEIEARAAWQQTELAAAALVPRNSTCGSIWASLRVVVSSSRGTFATGRGGRQMKSWPPVLIVAPRIWGRRRYAPIGKSTCWPIVVLTSLPRASNLVAARAQFYLARANRIPNIDVGPSYEQNEDSTEFWGVVTQMVLPTFGSRRAVARQRSADVQQSQVALHQLRRQATLEIGAALNLYDRWRTVAQQFAPTGHENVLGQVQTVEDLFEAGQSDLLRVYAARTRTMQVLIEYLQALDALAQAASNVIQAAAVPPDSLMTPLDRTHM